MSDEGEPRQEIIIVRRVSGEGEGHHGGAWKIAYADFVTAMMAFFLVMWLINSANEATRARVASYFNPIKMTDANPSGKGLKDSPNAKRNDSKDAKTDANAKGGDQSGNKGGKTNDHNVASSPSNEEAMMGNPFQALDIIAAEGDGSPSGRTVDITNQVTGDPFDPMAWEALKKGKTDTKVASTAEGETSANTGAAGEAKTDGSETAAAAGAAKAADPAAAAAAAGKDAQKLLAETTKQKLDAVVKKFEGKVDIKVDVKMTDEGLLIMLEDGSTRTMFDVGSAKPSPALIEVVTTIGQLLQQQKGEVTVRGHTDGRRFRNSRYDNWQLSTTRAHMASYMLMRGGLPEDRLARIEGYGASKLLDTENPLADENRRVEFLLAVPKGN